MKSRTERLTVGTWNIEYFGYATGRGHHRLPAALEWLLEQTPVPPDILALPEATHGLDDGEHAIRLAVNTLAPHLQTGWYEPMFSTRPAPGRRNHLYLLLVNTAKVRPVGWYDPDAADSALRHYGFAECEIFGHTVDICCEHWSGGEGREVFERASNRVSNKGGRRKTLLLGDFNADSSWEGELHHGMDWYEQCRTQGNLDKLKQKGWLNPATGRWEIDTRQIDDLRTIYDYVDMGEEYGDPTPTTKPTIGRGLRIDRIFRSRGFPGEPIEYAVRQPSPRLSDHAYVFGAYRVQPALGGS